MLPEPEFTEVETADTKIVRKKERCSQLWQSLDQRQNFNQYTTKISN